MDKFLGLGLMRLVAISIFVCLFIIVIKVVFAKYEVKGVSDVVHAI